VRALIPHFKQSRVDPDFATGIEKSARGRILADPEIALSVWQRFLMDVERPRVRGAVEPNQKKLGRRSTHRMQGGQPPEFHGAQVRD
jgi:hypothetical protein